MINQPTGCRPRRLPPARRPVRSRAGCGRRTVADRAQAQPVGDCGGRLQFQPSRPRGGPRHRDLQLPDGLARRARAARLLASGGTPQPCRIRPARTRRVMGRSRTPRPPATRRVKAPRTTPMQVHHSISWLYLWVSTRRTTLHRAPSETARWVRVAVVEPPRAARDDPRGQRREHIADDQALLRGDQRGFVTLTATGARHRLPVE
jgi:hypothetical protein